MVPDGLDDPEIEVIELPPLPYAYDALEPYLSAATLRAHHEGHLANYIRTVNRLVAQVPTLEGKSLAELVSFAERTHWTELYDAAAQAVNHIFYFQSMKPGGGGPCPDLREMMEVSFGGWEGFSKRWVDAAVSVFGSGWVWLVVEAPGRGANPRPPLKIVTTKDAGIPSSGRPIMIMDVWEHAYYLDYTFHRRQYAEAFLEHLVWWPDLWAIETGV